MSIAELHCGRGGVCVRPDYRPDFLNKNRMDERLSDEGEPIAALTFDYFVTVPGHQKDSCVRLDLKNTFGHVDSIDDRHYDVRQNEADFLVKLNENFQTRRSIFRDDGPEPCQRYGN